MKSIEVLEYLLEQEDTIEMSEMEEEFGSGTVTDIGDLEDKADQIHRVLLTLTSGETEDLMVGASNGFEAYRRVHRRWDPRTSGRKAKHTSGLSSSQSVSRLGPP